MNPTLYDYHIKFGWIGHGTAGKSSVAHYTRRIRFIVLRTEFVLTAMKFIFTHIPTVFAQISCGLNLIQGGPKVMCQRFELIARPLII